jgi:hypothetical protein
VKVPQGTKQLNNPMKQPERIELGAAGFGEASDITLEERARQIAWSDGRTEVNDLDREEARRQIIHPIADRERREDLIAEGDRPDAGVAPASGRFADATDTARRRVNYLREPCARRTGRSGIRHQGTFRGER